MLKPVYYFFVSLLLLGISRNIFPKLIVNNVGDFGWFLVVLTLFNWSIVPILQIITLPINFLTIGLASLTINLVFLNWAINLSRGIKIEASGFEYVFLLFMVSVILSLTNALVNRIT